MTRKAHRGRVALAPGGSDSWLAPAVLDGGGTIVEPADADALVWTELGRTAELAAVLAGDGDGIAWVQLPYAGIERHIDVVHSFAERTWTCGKGVYADPVAEHALALLLGGFRGVGRYARQTAWSDRYGMNLFGANIVILGGGGIAESLLRLLGPFESDITVVRKRPRPMRGASHVRGIEELNETLDGAVGVVVALALTPETDGIIGRTQLDAMHERGWLVNVARGMHVVTDDLVMALDAGRIGGAALDVTDPEPLPDSHPLWGRDNVVITPHVSSPPEMSVPRLMARVSENVRRWIADEPLIGLVDPALGY